MELDGARNAKAEILQHALERRETVGGGPDRLSVDIFGGAALAAAVTQLTRLGTAAVMRSGSSSRKAPQDPAEPNLEANRSPDRKAPGKNKSADARTGQAGEAASAFPVAVGIRPSRSKGDTSLVLIGNDAKLRDHPAVERAIRLAKGEATFMAGGEPEPLSFWQPARRRPLALGVSVGHHQASAGTLGGFVRLNDGSVCILSNNHVLANVNKGAPGDRIIQPGRYDGTGELDQDTIGTLRHAIPLETATVNLVDCAIADLDPSLQPTDLLAFNEGETESRLQGLAGGDLFGEDPVEKVGRTTGLTKGRVFAIEVDNYIVNMGSAAQPMRCRFDNQIQIYSDDRAFAAKGDSGALLLDPEGYAHGLLFAGSAAGGPKGTGLAVVNPLRVVLEQLDATLWIG